MGLLLGSQAPGWSPLGKATPVVQVSIGGGTTSVEQWHREKGGACEVSGHGIDRPSHAGSVREDLGWFLGSWRGRLGGWLHP